MFRRILVALDGSSFAEAALPVALGIARRSNGEVRLVTVRDLTFPAFGDVGWAVDETSENTARAAGASYLHDVETRLEPTWPKLSSVMRAGLPTDEILGAAEDFGADVIVMATHGHGPLTRFWLGSVATECAHRGHTPVLLVHPGDGLAPDAWDVDVTRIVVALDGSDLAERALGPGVELANLYGSPLTLIRIVHELTTTDPQFFPDAVATTEQIVEHDRADALSYLETVAQPLREWGLQVRTCAVAGAASEEILDEAGNDMLVMATHARTGFARAFLGSVTDAVIRGGPGPVLVIPPERATTKPILRTIEARLIEALTM